MDTIDYKALGQRIRTERRRRDLTQEKLAELADISNSFLGHIERGGRTLSVQTLVNLARALNMSTEYILFGEDICHPSSLPLEVQDAINNMAGNQRKVFLDVIKTLATNASAWRL